MRKIFLFIISFALPLFAQSKPLNFDFDYAQFFLNDSANYVEFYYQIEKDGLQTTQVNGRNVLSAIIKIELLNSNDSTRVISRKFEINSVVDTTTLKKKLMLGQFPLVVPFGNYNLSFTLIDKNNNVNLKTLKDNLEIISFPKDKPSMSNIELGRNIFKSKNNKSIFYKNTYEVIPNPNRIYSDNEPVIFYYAEIYNLKKAIGKGLNFLAVVLNSRGKKIYQKKLHLSDNNNSVVKVGQINLIKHPTGAYNLMLAVVDTAINYAYTSSKRFFLINPKVKLDSNIFSGKISISPRFSGMSSEEADLFFKKMRYISSAADKSKFKELKTSEQKQRFLTDFWKKKDTNPTTPENEFMNEYMRRLDYVAKHFKTRRHAGFMTDMGRVYLTYGPPDTIDRYPNNISTKPYELWYYHNIEGGVVFVFVDMLGIGEYDLVHSTKRGEVNNIRWRQLIGE